MEAFVSKSRARRDLGAVARAALGWSAGFTLLRDIIQFVTMLVLVRLLGPAEYGSMAMAQAIFSLVGFVSFKVLLLHALQQRDPSTIDWQAHFTAGAALNSVLFAITLGLAALLRLSSGYASVAIPLAVLSVAFLLEICSGVRLAMLETMHDWGRHRTLLMAGALLGAASGIVVALIGGGVLALAIQPLLFVLPAAIDLFVAGWMPEWSWSWAGYRETIRFGLNRAAPSGLFYGRKAIEQTLLSQAYSMAGLGVFTRSIGLAMLGVGRIGEIVSLTLYPVVTRSERGSAQFQKHAGLILLAVAWLTIPGAALLAISAPDVVLLLYGRGWSDVIPLLPAAAIAMGLVGVGFAAYNLLLANDQPTACLRLDVVSSIVAVALALCFVRSGAVIYLTFLALHGSLMLVLTLSSLRASDGITARGIADAFVPPIVAAGIGMCAAIPSYGLFSPHDLNLARLCATSIVFSVVYIAALRVAFPMQLTVVLEVAPAGRYLRRIVRL
jgi:O-antigen/teichoic acid export membrane protein